MSSWEDYDGPLDPITGRPPRRMRPGWTGPRPLTPRPFTDPRTMELIGPPRIKPDTLPRPEPIRRDAPQNPSIFISRGVLGLPDIFGWVRRLWSAIKT